MIYHYCGKEVFEKIIKTKIILLSDITKMNDEGEYKSGFQIIHDILKIYSDVDEIIATEMSPSNINNTFKVLISCFSRDGDVLSQWRAYADNGYGFSIGFDMEADAGSECNTFIGWLMGVRDAWPSARSSFQSGI